MHSDFRDKLRGSIRRPSLAGDGLPERMRSTVFAFLGLTAAAGLALVAIFAQLGFPLLSPTPLPDAPAPSSVSRAVPLGHGPRTVAIAQAESATAAPGDSADRTASGAAARGEGGTGGVDDSAVPVSGSPTGVDTGSDPPSAPPASPAPAPTPAPDSSIGEPAPAPVEAPASSPGIGEQPSKAKPVTAKPDTPEPEPSDPKADKPPKTKPDKPEATPAPEPSYDPAPAPTADDKKAKQKDKKDR